MKSQNEEQKLTEGQGKAKKPRFKIVKLEERIAPGGVKHPLPHGGPQSCSGRLEWQRGPGGGYCTTS